MCRSFVHEFKLAKQTYLHMPEDKLVRYRLSEITKSRKDLIRIK